MYLKYGNDMTNIQKVRKFISENGGVVKTANLVNLGITNSELQRLCSNDTLQKIKHGYYQLANSDEPREEKLIASFFPDGIICLDSALFIYAYSDRTPIEWTIAFNRNISRSRLDIEYPIIKPYFVDEKLLSIGKTEIEINGTLLNIFDRERVICDCFKYKNKIDSEIFNKAINAYIKDERKNLNNLSIYAKKLRVFKKMNEIIEVLINV